MADSKAIDRLFQRYLNDQCTPEEIKILLQYFDAGADEALLKSLILQQLESDDDEQLSAGRVQGHLPDAVFSNIKKIIGSSNYPGRLSVAPKYIQGWFRVAAAVILVLLLSTAAFFLFHKKEKTVIAYKENLILQKKDIAPGRTAALLTLSDGSTIVLDSAKEGTLARQGNIKVLKLNGRLSYHKGSSSNTANEKPLYNTLSTQRGNQYELVLADGSKVWLNAASSIRFPTAFSSKERRVEVSGEAYFEVAPLWIKGQRVPFRVKINRASGEQGQVEVLGTHFNINAYEDEPEVKTTLLEGKVKVMSGNAVQMLTPGQQARLTAHTITLNKNADISQTVAWKEGFFWFNNTDIHTIMRQVARWYDVEVAFEGKIAQDGFSGKIARNMPLSKLLKVLALSGVHFKTEGRKITVMA